MADDEPGLVGNDAGTSGAGEETEGGSSGGDDESSGGSSTGFDLGPAEGLISIVQSECLPQDGLEYDCGMWCSERGYDQCLAGRAHYETKSCIGSISDPIWDASFCNSSINWADHSLDCMCLDYDPDADAPAGGSVKRVAYSECLYGYTAFEKERYAGTCEGWCEDNGYSSCFGTMESSGACGEPSDGYGTTTTWCQNEIPEGESMRCVCELD